MGAPITVKEGAFEESIPDNETGVITTHKGIDVNVYLHGDGVLDETTHEAVYTLHGNDGNVLKEGPMSLSGLSLASGRSDKFEELGVTVSHEADGPEVELTL